MDIIAFMPIVLDGKVHVVPRSDILFTYCGTCVMQLTWKPEGGMVFRASCCRTVYGLRPASIDLKYFQIVQEAANMENVKLLPVRLKKIDGQG